MVENLNKSRQSKIPCPNCHKRSCNILGVVSQIGFDGKDNPNFDPNCNLIKCKYCKLIWKNPLPSRAGLSKNYQINAIFHYIFDFNFMHLIFWKLYTIQLNREYNLIRSYKKGGLVLDIGAGTGEFLSRFPSKLWSRYVFDPYLSLNHVKAMEKRISPHINKFRRLIDYPSGLFDVVILRDVAEHTTEFPDIFKQSYRLLKKNGIFFIKTPNMDSLDFKTFQLSWYVVCIIHHIVFFEKKALTDILKKNGFKIELNKPTDSSSVLSLFRSVNPNFPTSLRLIASFIYSIVSPLIGEGGDFIVIARK